MNKMDLVEVLRVITDKICDATIAYDKLAEGKSHLEDKLRFFRYDRWIHRSEEDIKKEIKKSEIELGYLDYMIDFVKQLKEKHNFNHSEIKQLLVELKNRNSTPEAAEKLFNQIKENKKRGKN